MNNLIGCLSYKDSINYFYLFPPFDSLWAFVMHNPDHSPEAVKELNHLKEHPNALLRFDPYYNRDIMAGFIKVLNKGEDSGIHWNKIVMQRYELSREVPSGDLIGYNRIAPERFRGYIFIRDLLGRLTFCITITEIHKIKGYFFGGQVINILEASTVDEYLKREAEEQKYFEWLAKNKKNDSTKNDSVKNDSAKNVPIDSTKIAADTGYKNHNFLSVVATDDDTAFRTRREVVDRRYYEGKFDDEIPVKLYVRYMKDLRSGNISAYDGLYKFGDQVNYVKLHITRSKDGKWNMEDDPPVGSMELELKNKVYTGSWTNSESQNGYDVELKQTDITQRKLEQLDYILEKGLSGRVDEDTIPEKKGKKKADVNDSAKDKDKSKEEDNTKKKEKPKDKDDDE